MKRLLFFVALPIILTAMKTEKKEHQARVCAISLSMPQLKKTEKCMICLADIDTLLHKRTNRLSCRHAYLFHAYCLDEWKKYSFNCPMCRQPMQKSITDDLEQYKHYLKSLWNEMPLHKKISSLGIIGGCNVLAVCELLNNCNPTVYRAGEVLLIACASIATVERICIAYQEWAHVWRQAE